MNLDFFQGMQTGLLCKKTLFIKDKLITITLEIKSIIVFKLEQSYSSFPI